MTSSACLQGEHAGESEGQFGLELQGLLVPVQHDRRHDELVDGRHRRRDVRHSALASRRHPARHIVSQS